MPHVKEEYFCLGCMITRDYRTNGDHAHSTKHVLCIFSTHGPTGPPIIEQPTGKRVAFWPVRDLSDRYYH